MKQNQAIAAIQRWGPTLLMMALIFYFSSLPAEQVVQASKPFDQTVQPLVNDLNRSLHTSLQFKPDWLKIGHVIGYLGLGLAFRHGWQPTLKNGGVFWIAILCCLLYALTDEVHQIFVEGRMASFKDVGLDTLASTSALILQAAFSKIRPNY